MDQATELHEGRLASKNPGHRRRKGALLVIGAIFCLGFLALAVIHDPPSRGIVLRTQSEGALKPSKFDMVWNKVAGWIDPMLRRFRAPRPSISIPSKIMVLKRNDALQSLGPASATNADGNEAWLLSEGQLAAFEKMRATNSDLTTVSAPSVIVSDRRQAAIMVGSTLPALAGGGRIGLDLSMLPELRRGKVRLTFVGKLTDLNGLAQTPQSLLVTNFWVAGRAFIPDGGALVLHAASNVPGGTNYLLIISPRAIDATGKPLKR